MIFNSAHINIFAIVYLSLQIFSLHSLAEQRIAVHEEVSFLFFLTFVFNNTLPNRRTPMKHSNPRSTSTPMLS